MDISAFEVKLKRLLDEVSNLPAAPSSKTILLSPKSRHKRVFNASDTDTLNDSLEQLRLVVKYLIFDAEATRRENQYLRKVLEEQEE